MPDRPVPSPTRRRLEEVSRPPLVRLTALPKSVVPIATVVLLAVGVLAPPEVGLVALGLVALFVAWLTYLAWPAVRAGGRLVRLLMLALVLVLAATRL